MTELTIELSGGAPWGFRLHGGRGTPIVLTVAKVRRRSRAHGQLQEGDCVHAIGGQSVEGLSHDEAMALVDSHSERLELRIIRGPKPPPPPPAPQPTASASTLLPSSLAANGSQEQARTGGSLLTTVVSHDASGDRRASPQSSVGRDEPVATASSPAFGQAGYVSYTTARETPPPEQRHQSDQRWQQQQQADHPLIPSDINAITQPADPHASDTTTDGRAKLEAELHQTQQRRLLLQTASEDTAAVGGPAESADMSQTGNGSSRGGAAVRRQPANSTTLATTMTTTMTASVTSSSTTTTAASTVNISGAKFDLGFDMPSQSFGGGEMYRKQQTSHTASNPFAGMEQILSGGGVSGAKQAGGGLERLDDSKTKLQFKSTTDFKVTSVTTPLSVTTWSPSQQNEPAAPTTAAAADAAAAAGDPNDDVLLISPTGRPIKERYYKPLTDDQLKQIDDLMAPIMSKKKIFASSSFYEDENSTYPTVEEQVDMARKIAESLSSDSNAQSRGANMFYRRVKRSHKWVHQAPGVCESEYTESEDYSSVPDPNEFPGVKVSKEPPKLKLLMAPAVSQDRWNDPAILQDVPVSPDVCLDIVKGLNSQAGKGAQMFAKRKKKSEDWVVDVDKLKAQLGDKWPEKENVDASETRSLPRPRVQAPRITDPASTPAERYLDQVKQQQQETYSRLRLIKSPWEAALESPVGSVDSAFQTVTVESGIRPWGSRAPLSSLAVSEIGPPSKPIMPMTTSSTAGSAPYATDALSLGRSPRGWGAPRTATPNLCVTVNKAKPPPPTPPPRPIVDRTFSAQSAPAAPDPPSALIEIEAGPPVKFYNSLDELIQSGPPPPPPAAAPLKSASQSCVPTLSGKTLASPEGQYFNSMPRGFGFGGRSRDFRSVHL